MSAARAICAERPVAAERSRPIVFAAALETFRTGRLLPSGPQ